MLDWQKCKLLKTEKNREMTTQQCFFYLKLYKECEMLHTYCQKKLSGLKISLGTYTYYISYYFVFLVVICILNTIHCKVSKNQIYWPDYFMLTYFLTIIVYHFLLWMFIYTCTCTSRIATCNEKRSTLHSFRRCYLVVSRFQSD